MNIKIIFLYGLKPSSLATLQNNYKQASRRGKDTKYEDRKTFSVTEKLGFFFTKITSFSLFFNPQNSLACSEILKSMKPKGVPKLRSVPSRTNKICF